MPVESPPFTNRDMNCLTHALDRLIEHGGYLSLRCSHNWDVLHAIWQDARRAEISNYVPPKRLRCPAQSILGFEGVVVTTDECGVRRITPNGVVASAFLFFWIALAWRIGLFFRKGR